MPRSPDPQLAKRRRREILDAAEIRFRRRGFHQATMQEICAEARISPGALYRYFRSKADIIAAIAEEKQRESEAAFKLAWRQGGVVEALTAVLERLLIKLGSAEQGPIFADILGEAARDPILARRLAAIDAEGIARLAEAISAAQKDGEIDPAVDAGDAAETLVGAISGLGLRCALHRSGDRATVLRQFRTLAERYLAAAPRDATYPAATAAGLRETMA
jgi:AcrR family transcriptional regulator